MQLTLLKSLTTIGLGFVLSSMFINVAKAETLYSSATSVDTNDSSLQEITPDEPMLLSQLRGHEVYMGEEQIEWENKMLGHVVGQSGTIAYITLPDGRGFRADVAGIKACPGDDVLVGEDDNGNLYLIGTAHSRWISILESKYGWKRLDYANYRPLTERTAELWAQLESRPKTSTRMAVPPRVTPQSRPYTPPPEPAPTPQAPVRGLW